MKALLAVVGLALAAASLPAPARAAAKLRALVVTGGHDFEHEPFVAMLNSFQGIEWREAKHPEADVEFASDKRKDYDVIVLYDMPQDMPEQRRNELAETVRRGKGLVVLHHALGAYPDWPEYTRIIGGRYLMRKETLGGREWPPSTYRHDVRFTVQIADIRHPITRGLKDFEIVDEVYGGFWMDPKAHALLRTTHPESGPVIGWTWRYGRARVVYLEGGHGPTAYGDPNYRALVQRSIEWVAGRR